MKNRVWIGLLAWGIIAGSSVAGDGKSLTFRIERNDCIKQLVARTKAAADSIPLAVTRNTKLRSCKLVTTSGLAFFAGQSASFFLPYLLANLNKEVAETVPGCGVENEEFIFSPVEGDPSKLGIAYVLKVKSEEKGRPTNTSVVQIQANGDFSKGDWNAFAKGNTVEFGFSPGSEPCLKRVIGPSLDSGSNSLGEEFYMLLSCPDGEVDTRHRNNRTQLPPVFKGTRSQMVFEGPSSSVDVTIGISTSSP